MWKKGRFSNNQIQATHSIVNLGGSMKNVSIHSKTEKRTKTEEELIKEIQEKHFDYIREITLLDQLNPSDRDQAIQAIMDIQKELNQETPDKQKIKSIWEPVQKSSYIAAICSAICDFVQL